MPACLGRRPHRPSHPERASAASARHSGGGVLCGHHLVHSGGGIDVCRFWHRRPLRCNQMLPPYPPPHPRTMVQARICGGCAHVSAPTHHKSARLQGTRRLRWRCACRCCQPVQQGTCHCSTISCTLEARPQASQPPAEAHHMDRQPHCTCLVLTQCIAQRSAHIAVHEGGKACRTTVGTGSIISASSCENATPCSCCQLTRICVADSARCRCHTRQHQAVKVLQQHLLG